MTRRNDDQDRAPDPEPTAVRPGEEPSAAAGTWRKAGDPRDGLLEQIADGLSNHLIAELDDREFLIAMRNRLLQLEQERSSPAMWRRFRRLLFREAEKTRMAGYDIKRLLGIAGQPPPEGLRDRDYAVVSYDQLRRMISAAEVGLADGEDAPA